MKQDHDRALSEAFDVQAPRFERAPVQSDPVALARLAGTVGLPADSLLLDAGCGPGLVCESLLMAGYRVVGVDLSQEMIERARKRCAPWGDGARFHRVSLFDPSIEGLGPFDGVISRYVLHHVVDPPAFLGRQVSLLRPGGVVVLCDHETDPDPRRAELHEAIERARDRTHTRNLTAGQLLDLMARSGLVDLQLAEERFTLDFDEWFDRGTPAMDKAEVRSLIASGPSIRGFDPRPRADGGLSIDCVRALARGVKPAPASADA
jgi:SAM-dependent methyltransferase